MPVAHGNFEEAKKADVFVAGKGIVERHHFEGIRRSLNLQTSTCNVLPVQNASRTVMCKDAIHLIDQQINSCYRAWIEIYPCLPCTDPCKAKAEVSKNSAEEDQFFHLFLFSGF